MKNIVTFYSHGNYQRQQLSTIFNLYMKTPETVELKEIQFFSRGRLYLRVFEHIKYFCAKKREFSETSMQFAKIIAKSVRKQTEASY